MKNFFILLIFVSINLFAKDIIVAELEEIKIIEDKDISLEETVNSISVLTATDIENFSLKSVADVIKKSSGILINTNGTRASINSTSIRGSSSTQVAIFVDGVRISSSGGGVGYYDISKLPADIIEKVEIYKGSNSAKFGEGVIGGAINIVLKKGRSLFQTEFNFSSVDGIGVLLNSFFPVKHRKDLMVSLSAEFVYNPFNLDIMGGDTIDNFYLGFFKFGLNNSNTKYDLSYFTLVDETYSNELIGNLVNSFNNINQLQWKIKDVSAYAGKYAGNFSFNIYDIFYKGHNVLDADNNLNFLIDFANSYSIYGDFENCSINYSIDFEFKCELLKSSTLSLLSRQLFSPSTSLNIEFSHKEKKIGMFDLVLSFDGIVGDKTLYFPTFFTGFLFFFGDSNYGIKTSVGNGFKAPTMVQLYYNTQTILSNSALEAEKSLSYDLSLFFKIGKNINFNIGYFLRDEHNTIFLDINRLENLPSLMFNGLEADLNMNFAFLELSNIGFGFNYTFNYGLYKKDWSRFDKIHTHIFKASAVYSYDKIFSFWTNVDYYSGYGVDKFFIDFSFGSKLFFKNFYIDLGLYNILNHHLRYHNWTTYIPMAVKVSFGYKKDIS